MNKQWIGVDLDGTLAHYDGWKGVDHIGEPVPAMLERVKRWLANGTNVRICTARVSPRDSQELLRSHRVIQEWCMKHLGQAIPVTNAKDFDMCELWDDRCIQVEKNTGRRIDGGE